MNKTNEYWKNLANKITSPVETKNKRPDTSDLEIEFLSRYLKSDDDILDVGSGSGLIINKLVDFVKNITAVEKYEGFSKFIIDDPKIFLINADLLGFNIRKEFDAVLCLGVAQCFSRPEITDIYHKLYSMVRSGGLLIIRSHCGLEKDKTVNGFSDELQTDYFAQYRHLDSEIALLKNDIGFESVEIFDFLPDTINVWPDTRHFYFVCKKK